MNSLAKAGHANQSASEMPAGAAIISGSLYLRCKRKSGRRQAFSSSDGRPELSRPLNGYIKRQFGFQKTRLRGMLKNRCKVNVLAALSNLFMARHELLCRT